MNTSLVLAVADAGGLAHELFTVLMECIAIAIIWGLGMWLARTFGIPETPKKIWNALFAIIGAIFIIDFLLSLTGHGFIRW